MAAFSASQATCRTASALRKPVFAAEAIFRSVSNLSSKRSVSLRPRVNTVTSRPPQVRAQKLHVFAMGAQTQQAPADQAKFFVYCKGDPQGGNPSEKGTLLDCPFSQRVMLTLEEKKVPYIKQLCNEQDLPKFLGDVHPAGQPLIPVVKDLENDKFVGESDEIVKYIESKYPSPKLGTPDTCSSAGDGIFPDKYMNFLLAEGSEEAKARDELDSALKQLDQELGKTPGPFLSGEEPCAQCVKLAPQLMHIGIGAERIKGYSIPKEYKNIHAFMDAWQARPSWEPAAPVNDAVVEDGWRQKIKQKKEQS